MKNPVKGVVEAWNRFWFEPVSTSTLALVRIGFGLLTLVWTLTLLPDLRWFFSSTGVLPKQPPGAWVWGLLERSSSMPLVTAVFVMLLLGSIGLLLGCWTRLSALLVFVGLMTLQRRNPWILTSGDWLMRIMAFYLVFAPAGAALSLDRYFNHRESFWDSPLRSPWVLRLIQIQLSAVYFFSVWDKVQGTTWNEGTAVSYALRMGDLQRFHLPHAITSSALLSGVLTYGALATELSLALLVWNRKARPYVLLAGVFMHLMIDGALIVGFFSYQVFVAYLAWVPPDRLDSLLASLRQRFSERRSRARAELAGAPDPGISPPPVDRVGAVDA